MIWHRKRRVIDKWPLRFSQAVGLLTLVVLIAFARTACGFQSAPTATREITKTVEPDGVIRWESKSAGRRPRFFDELSSITGVTMPEDPNQLTWGRSVALLVGVGMYNKNLDALPGVSQSIAGLRKYLLAEGGLDTVYEISDTEPIANPAATPAMVANLMTNRFNDLNSNDRLLFYFAGHGTDRNATTGYLLFRNADISNYSRDDWLSTAEIREWSGSIKARHILFLL